MTYFAWTCQSKWPFSVGGGTKSIKWPNTQNLPPFLRLFGTRRIRYSRGVLLLFFKKNEFEPEFHVKRSKNSCFWPFPGDFVQPNSCVSPLRAYRAHIEISLNLQVKSGSKKMHFRLFRKICFRCFRPKRVFFSKELFSTFWPFLAWYPGLKRVFLDIWLGFF